MKKYFLPLSILPLSAIAGMAFAFTIANGNAVNNVVDVVIPDTVEAKNEIHIATIHAEGSQIYECKADVTGELVWQFREPVATLYENGSVVGYHYAGPRWELTDGSMLAANFVARANGATPADIPLLKLEVTKWSSVGRIAEATTIQRINTKGGVADGSCSTDGELRSVPYTADYVFSRKLQKPLLTY